MCILRTHFHMIDWNLGLTNYIPKKAPVMHYIDFICILWGLTFFMLQEVVTDLMRQIQELRSSINHKTESIDGLTRELEDINVCSVILKDVVSFCRNGRQWHVLSWVSNSITCCSVLEGNFFVLTCWNLLNILCLRLSQKLNPLHVVGKKPCL